MTPQNRIPELDLMRGFCILVMAAVHFIYDLTELYPVFQSAPPHYLFLKEQGGAVFFLISGVSATLGSHPLKRGLQVFLCGMLVSAVTGAAGFPVRFGVLSCLGVCMLLWTLFRSLPAPPLIFFSAAALLLGTVFPHVPVSAPFLYPLGLCRPDFQSADYFPLFPFFGFFLAGSCLGRRLYRNRRSLLPRFSFSSPPARFLRLCGRKPLILYLAHQPFLIFTIETAIFIGGVFREI